MLCGNHWRITSQMEQLEKCGLLLNASIAFSDKKDGKKCRKWIITGSGH